MEFQDCSDARLTALVRERQGDAFVELSARYLGLIRAKAKLFEGVAAPEKEDLWQEGLLGLYAAAISFRPERGASFSTYAGVCVYNRMTSAVRRHASSGNRPLNESISLEDAGDAAVEASPEEQLELQEDFRALQQRMGVSLSPMERRVLTLYLSGYRRGEAADRAGITVRAYDNALHRVRSKLKRL